MTTLQTEPLDVGGRKQLFIDRKFIQADRGIVLAMNPPRLAGTALRGDRPWDRRRVGPFFSVVEEEGVYRMWYAGIGEEGQLCYATSTDGVRWQKPADGRSATIIPDFVGQGAVFRDPVAPPAERYKTLARYNMLGSLGFATEGGTMMLASPDGLRWKREHLVLPFKADTQNCVFWDGRIGKYAAYLRGWNPLRVVVRCEIPRERIFEPWAFRKRAQPNYLWRVFEGRDHWPPAISTELPTVMSCDEQDPPNSDVYTPSVHVYPWADDAYVAFPAFFRHLAPPGSEKIPMHGLVDVHLMVSRDGVRWSRPERRPYIGLAPAGESGSRQVYMGLGLVRRGVEIYQYYAGLSSFHAKPPENSAIMRAVQRLDGFVSANAGGEPGEFTTPLLRFQGSRLTLNLDTSATGVARVEIQSEDGLPAAGFELRNSDSMVCNETARACSWRGSTDVSVFQHKPVRLRFVMRSARLFAFQFTEG